MPQEGDKRLTQKEWILLPKGKDLDTSIHERETMGFVETSEEELHNEAGEMRKFKR